MPQGTRVISTLVMPWPVGTDVTMAVERRVLSQHSGCASGVVSFACCIWASCGACSTGGRGRVRIQNRVRGGVPGLVDGGGAGQRRGGGPLRQPRKGFEGANTINRKDWNLIRNPALETDGRPVSDKVKLELDISAIRSLMHTVRRSPTQTFMCRVGCGPES